MDIVHYSYRIINFKGTWHFMKKITRTILNWIVWIIYIITIILLIYGIIKSL